MKKFILIAALMLSSLTFGLYNVGQTVSINDQNIEFDVCNNENPQTGEDVLTLADLNGELNGGSYYVFHIDMAASW